MSKTEQLHFSVEGSFIMDAAREGYWFEDRKEWALDVLSCLKGMTTEQDMKVLRGDAKLSDDGNGNVEYREIEDSEFKKKLSKHLRFLEEQSERDKRERVERLHREFAIFFDDKEVKPISDPTKLGSFTVSKSLLDEYVNLYLENHFAFPSVFTLQRSLQLMNTHRQLRISVGLSGYQSVGEDDEFDKALTKLCLDTVDKDKRGRERLEQYRLRREKSGD